MCVWDMCVCLEIIQNYSNSLVIRGRQFITVVRYLLLNKLEKFKQWLIDDGWNIEAPKGDWEVLRARKPGRKNPLIIYTKMDVKEHLSVMSRDASVLSAFLRNSN